MADCDCDWACAWLPAALLGLAHVPPLLLAPPPPLPLARILRREADAADAGAAEGRAALPPAFQPAVGAGFCLAALAGPEVGFEVDACALALVEKRAVPAASPEASAPPAPGASKPSNTGMRGKQGTCMPKTSAHTLPPPRQRAGAQPDPQGTVPGMHATRHFGMGWPNAALAEEAALAAPSSAQSAASASSAAAVLLSRRISQQERGTILSPLTRDDGPTSPPGEGGLIDGGKKVISFSR